MGAYVLLLQEFDIEIKDKKGSKNIAVDHLLRLELDSKEDEPIKEVFPDEMLLEITYFNSPWFADIANFISIGEFPETFTKQEKKKLIYDSKSYLWDDPFLWKLCNDGMLRRCIANEEIGSVLQHCHGMVTGGHFGPQRTAAKILEVGFFWPTLFQDAQNFILNCDACHLQER